MITYLREKKNISLHIACGEIRDVEFNGTEMIVRSQEEHLFNIVNADHNTAEIKEALKWQGLDLEVKVELVPKEEDLREKDIAFLKEKFGEFFKIL